MKILFKGSIPPNPMIGMKGTCGYCKTVIQIEEDDIIAGRVRKGYGSSVITECPVCNCRIWFCRIEDFREECRAAW